MKGNLFSDIYFVEKNMYGGCSAQDSINNLQESVQKEIINNLNPSKLRYLMFKITNWCNSDCEYCTHALSRNNYEIKSEIPLEIIVNTIKEASDIGVTAIAINGGEPLTRGDIIQIISTIVKFKIVPVLLTNGILLPQIWDQLGAAGLKYVIISLDSINKNIYEKQRGVCYEKAVDGVNAAIKMREKYNNVDIHVSAVLTKYNQSDIINLIKYMSSKRIKVQIIPYHNYVNLDEDISISEYIKINQLTEKLLDMKKEGYLIANSTGFIRHFPDFFINKMPVPHNYRCKVGYTNLFVDAYMNIRPCWDSNFEPLGNLNNNKLSDIWNGERMIEYRRKMLNVECNGCWYICTGEVTMLLDNILDDE